MLVGPTALPIACKVLTELGEIAVPARLIAFPATLTTLKPASWNAYEVATVPTDWLKDIGLPVVPIELIWFTDTEKFSQAKAALES